MYELYIQRQSDRFNSARQSYNSQGKEKKRKVKTRQAIIKICSACPARNNFLAHPFRVLPVSARVSRRRFGNTFLDHHGFITMLNNLLFSKKKTNRNAMPTAFLCACAKKKKHFFFFFHFIIFFNPSARTTRK